MIRMEEIDVRVRMLESRDFIKVNRATWLYAKYFFVKSSFMQTDSNEAVL